MTALFGKIRLSISAVNILDVLNVQKLIIIRGHSGSGKSTFAHHQILAFQRDYPLGRVFHIENDHFLMLDGEYHWTPERFVEAKQQAQALLDEAFVFCEQHKNQDVLIVVSNVGGNVQEILQMQTRAAKLHLQTKIYRLQNFFKNAHRVNQQIVYEMYLHLMKNPMEDEILVPVIQPMTAKVRSEIEKLQAQKRKNRYTKKM